ncbi:hypothetical protein MUK42_29407 [Musa troglodytarum]|uniref:Uncharacterized protein n=1 Tax=Musa troglodytarum TaxID=320322 RepID=A0A9E7K904_9LILI|nr:hypothetical protein MUK42_29407 [Musa troglodytarum]
MVHTSVAKIRSFCDRLLYGLHKSFLFFFTFLGYIFINYR